MLVLWATAGWAQGVLDVEIINGYVDINGDGVIDAADDGSYDGFTVIDGAIDTDGNGIPDQCECSGDTDGNNVIDLEDFHGAGDPAGFAPCFGGGPYTPDDPCAVHDVDDGLRAGLITVEQLNEVPLFNQQFEEVRLRYPSLAPRRVIHEVVRRLIN